MNLSGIAVHTALMAGFTVLQTTVLRNGVIAGANPDIALLILVFSASQHGSLKGEGAGFVTGLLRDFLSLAPLGFNAFVGTVMGYLYGISKGKLFVDPILMPVLLGTIATVVKAVLSILLLAIFAPEQTRTVFGARFGVEVGLNALIAPFLYGLLHLAGVFRATRERS